MHGVLDYLERAAEHFPDKTAIACRDEAYTFSALRDGAKALAASIRTLHIENEAVGVIVRRSAETAMLFLAVAYSGNFYVPMDPAMPEKKLSTIADDSGMRLVLGQERDRALAERLGLGLHYLTADDRGEERMEAPETEADTPLYLVYTSGSTGRPKGVLKSHGAVMSFIEAFTDTFALGAEEIIGNQTPFFFDASAKDIYLMLRTGATMEVIPSEMFMLPTALVEYLNEKRVSYICWVPTALSMVIQMNAFRRILPVSLKWIFFVGEVFPVKYLRKWKEALPQPEYVNLYGSSELAGICCWYRVGESIPEDALPMGRPLSNCRIFLRDGETTVTQPDRLGEVCIVSDALALGYFRDEERTEKSFVTEALPDGTRARVFHSGDLARYDGEGNLVFSCRSDFQIKHLGKRIELGEIESVCDSLPEVERCCCLYDKKSQQIRLFCQLKAGCGLDGKAIRERLRQELSDYMVPQRVTVLDAMPYNANGKINRTLLAEM